MVHFKAFFVYCGNCEGYPFAHGCIHFKSAYMKQLEFGTVFYKLVFVHKQNCSVYLWKVLNSYQLETELSHILASVHLYMKLSV